MNAHDSSSITRPTNVRWIVFALTCGTSWMLYLHRYTFAFVKPELQNEWNLTNAELGLMDSAFTFCYMAFQVPTGVCVDAVGPHFVLGGLILLWSIGLGLHAWAPNAKALVVARATLGIGQAGVYATLSRITRIWFPLSVRTSVQGWAAVFSGRMGAACAGLIFSTVLVGIVFKDDWRTALYLLVAAGIVLGIIFLVVFRDSPPAHPWVNQAEVELIEESEHTQEGRPQRETSASRNNSKNEPTQRMKLREMFRRMSGRSVLNLLSVNLQSILSYMADAIYSLWIPKFLYDVHQMEFKQMGIYSALPLLGGACGGALGGFLNDRMIRLTGNRRWSRTTVALVGKAMAGVLILCALLLYDNPYWFCVLLFFVKFFGDWSLSTAWGTLTDIGGKATATVFAFNNTVASFVVMFVSPIYGYVADHHGWKPVFIIVGIVYLLCAASWLLVNCTIPLIREEAELGTIKP